MKRAECASIFILKTLSLITLHRTHTLSREKKFCVCVCFFFFYCNKGRQLCKPQQSQINYFKYIKHFWKLTCLANTAMSSLKESEEQTSPPATPGSLGVHVANSHFSKTSASSGNKGWLQEGGNTAWVTSSTPAPQSPLQKMSRQPACICRLPATPQKTLHFSHNSWKIKHSDESNFTFSLAD